MSGMEGGVRSGDPIAREAEFMCVCVFLLSSFFCCVFVVFFFLLLLVARFVPTKEKQRGQEENAGRKEVHAQHRAGVGCCSVPVERRSSRT